MVRALGKCPSLKINAQFLPGKGKSPTFLCKISVNLATGTILGYFLIQTRQIMFGICHAKFDPTQYVIQIHNGKTVREGAGLSFWFFAPVTTLLVVPVGTTDSQFMFEEVTSDFQNLTIQGQFTYRITDPGKLAQLLNYTIHPRRESYISKDPEKLQLRLINAVNVLTKSSIHKLDLRNALNASSELAENILTGLGVLPEIASLGIEVLGVSILSIKPNPETARALEAETRERLLKEADDATYSRRNAAVEQERLIRENELLTEKTVQEKQHELAAAETAHQVATEKSRKELVVLETENSRNQADARAYALEVVVKALVGTDPRIVQALANVGMQPDHLIAGAMQEIASNAEKIGQLNISSELLSELLKSPSSSAKPSSAGTSSGKSRQT